MNAAQLADAMLQGRVGDIQAIAPQYPGRVGVPNIQPQYPGVGLPVENQGGGPVQNPVRYSEAQYVAGDVTYLGFGSTSIPAGSTGTVVHVDTARPFRPQKMGCPSSTIGLLINQVSISGTNVYANQAGVPVELLSEVSTFPQMNIPDLDTATGVDFTVANPTAGALPFQGAFYGTQLRR